MTLSSRHRIRNSSPGGLRPSTLPLGHGGSPQYWLSHVDGEKTFLFLSNRRVREPNSGVKGSGANHYPRAPALLRMRELNYLMSGWDFGPPRFRTRFGLYDVNLINLTKTTKNDTTIPAAGFELGLRMYEVMCVTTRPLCLPDSYKDNFHNYNNDTSMYTGTDLR